MDNIKEVLTSINEAIDFYLMIQASEGWKSIARQWSEHALRDRDRAIELRARDNPS
jgi:hypothetical protein